MRSQQWNLIAMIALIVVFVGVGSFLFLGEGSFAESTDNVFGDTDMHLYCCAGHGTSKGTADFVACGDCDDDGDDGGGLAVCADVCCDLDSAVPAWLMHRCRNRNVGEI